MVSDRPTDTDPSGSTFGPLMFFPLIFFQSENHFSVCILSRKFQEKSTNRCRLLWQRQSISKRIVEILIRV